MYKFDNILVPTDFSANAQDALEYAKEIAKFANSTIHVLNVLEPLMIPVDTANYPSTKVSDVLSLVDKHSREKMSEISDFLSKNKIKNITAIEKGKPADIIYDYSNKNDIDAICIGTQGSTGIQHFLFGSTSDKVLRIAECPVIAVKMKKRED